MKAVRKTVGGGKTKEERVSHLKIEIVGLFISEQ